MKINDEMIPALEEAYEYHLKESEKIVTQSECLNISRAITQAAKSTLKEGYAYDEAKNKTILSNLNNLEDYDNDLNKESKDLNEILEQQRDWFIKENENILSSNNDIMDELTNGTTSADDLMIQIQDLGKRLMNIINDDIPEKTQDIDNFIFKIEDKYCEYIEQCKENISKIDPDIDTMQKSSSPIEWSYVEPEIFYRRAAFTDKSYSATR